MDLKNFTSAMSQIADEKGISPTKVIESIETALAAAYKKDYGQKGQIIKSKLDPITGSANFWQVKLVVTEEMIYSEEELEAMKNKDGEVDLNTSKEVKEGEVEKIRFNEERHIMLDEAKKINKKIKAGEELEIPLEAKQDYGRIAAQTAKQVILQKIREAERETVFGEYKSKEGEIVSGVIQRIEGRNIFIDVGKTLGVMPKEEQIYGEFYRPGQRLKFYIIKVDETSKGPAILLSRAYPKFVSKLFELEVPEISAGQVVIKAIAREAGSRSKVALMSNAEGIDPIGSAVGQRGSRVMAVISELGGEKIDIIQYSDKPEGFIANALSPAKVTEVKVLPKNRAICIVPEDQLSLAIGKDGQNVRLAAKLTGWKIDVRTEGEPVEVKAELEEKTEEADNKKE
jgi:transcription termination/antitermination protein NusA